jgi:hypothetical protein
MCAQHLPAFGGEPVITTPALSCLLHPAAIDQSALLEPIQHRIQRGDLEGDGAIGARLDQLADLVAVTRTLFEEREDQQLRASFLHFPPEQVSQHISHRNIWFADICQWAGWWLVGGGS